MHSTKELVARRFDALAPSYDDKSANRKAYLATIDDLLVDLLNSRPGLSPAILDVGTGTGTRIEGIRARLANGSIISACDLSSAMVEIAKTRNIDEVKLADMTILPYADQQFDYLFCLFGAYGYLPTTDQRATALNEFSRVLKPGGKVALDIINRWHRGEGMAFRKARAKIIGELFMSLVRPSINWGDVMFESKIDSKPTPGFFHTFTDREIRKLVGSARLRVDSFAVVGYETGQIHTSPSKGNFMYILEKPA